MKHYITVFEGNEKMQTYLLNILPSFSSGRITIGRLQTNDIVLPYQSVSRSHAVIELRGDVLDIVDTGSLNKLRVNGVAYERIRLVDGLSVTIGTSVNTISLQYTVAEEPDFVSPQPGAAKTDDNTAVFDLKKMPHLSPVTEAPKNEIPALQDDDAGWAPMPRGSSHKAEPVSIPVNRRPAAQMQSKPSPQPSAQAQPDKKVAAAYMGKRLIAFMADFVICAFMIVGAAVLMLLALNRISGVEVIAILTFIVAIAVSWIYYTLGESGETGATLGKMALGLRVIDIKTRKTISVKTATKRFFAKILSALILFLGFLPIFGRKQTFHDYISGTRVVKNR